MDDDRVRAHDDERYEAHRTATDRRRGHEECQVVQHRQTPPIALQHLD